MQRQQINDQIQNILTKWDLKNPYIEEQIKEDLHRPVYKIKADQGCYILKGFSGDTPESTIMSNVSAHLFLGNEKDLAPRVYSVKTGAYSNKHPNLRKVALVVLS